MNIVNFSQRFSTLTEFVPGEEERENIYHMLIVAAYATDSKELEGFGEKEDKEQRYYRGVLKSVHSGPSNYIKSR